jgi:hypothetical protein
MKEKIPSPIRVLKCISSHADTEGYHTMDFLVTGFNAFDAEGKRYLFMF